ncbi:nitroreductase family deazaflavin-dependent oxidoreductase [Nostocoides sp. HKS02]|uniref:nitroreductase family deazaflavin-dependent oxidoreductase n=1 Tax=Nostocoides sp. HKS02 TaxID=1813880 RepID=UPI0012B4F969|nr:nitroreductase family deazaflavin-dependent oxidoreductase [Tetrasphaera sp. HKS02]QGN58906.1 nitroreductase family deazaflavin-dependent oxidoreductase [Tetrasphaera sp. HKS02]
MPSLTDRLTHTTIAAHGKVYARTGGRIGHRLLGVPCLLLHTVGAKSGLPRINSLTYAMDGPAYVVVASAGGGPKSPGWYHNLRANPQVVAQVGTRRVPVTSRVVMPGEHDYERLWRLVNDQNKQRYAAYQRLTSRPIPVVVLSPS